MEEKLPNDRLEEFLKKALGNHTEDPSDDLWDRIELELPEAPPSTVAEGGKLRRLPQFGRWWGVAAAAVVAGIVIGQHLYFQHKLNDLSGQLEQNAVEIERLEKRNHQIQEDHTKKTLLEGSHPNGTASGMANAQPAAPSAAQPAAGKTARQPQSGKTLPIAAPKTGAPAAAVGSGSNAPDQEVAIGSGAPPSQVGHQQPAVEAAETQPAVAAGQSPHLEPNLLNTKILGVVEAPVSMPTTGYLSKQIIPAKYGPTGKISVGAHYAWGGVRDELKVRKQPGGGGQGGGQGGGGKKYGIREMNSIGQTWSAGIVAEDRLAKNLFIGTGLAYRKTTFESGDTVKYEYKDHRPGQGSNHHDRNFDYNFGTPAGLVELELRASLVDSTMEPDEDEEIDIEIKTRQDLAFLSVPLYAGYRIGEGRLRVLAKGGLRFNFLIGNEFEVTDIVSQNDKFRFERHHQSHGKPLDLQAVSVDFAGSVGLEYALTRSLNLRVEPALTASLTSLHNSQFIQSSQYSAGVNAGVMYVF